MSKANIIPHLLRDLPQLCQTPQQVRGDKEKEI
jgi:hypothetical protein